MKNFKTLFGMAAVALIAAACTNDVSEVLAPEAPQQGIPFVATLAPKSFNATTRTLLSENTDGTISSAWQVGDEITLRYGTDYATESTATVTEVKEDGSATIEATLESGITDGDEVLLWYAPGSFADQDGELSNKLDHRFGSGKFKVTGGVASLDGSVTMKASGSIFKFTLQDLGGNVLNVKELTISTEGVERSSVTLASAASSFYVAFDAFVAEDSEVWFTATDESDNPYIAKVTATKDVEAGYYYQSTLKMATLGDLMNSDGSFSAGAEDGKTPIGVIAYLGNDATVESTEDGGGHGLVMALENADGNVKWSTDTETWQFGESAAVTNVEALLRTTDVSGYTNTKTLVEKTDAGDPEDLFPAAYYAWNYSEKHSSAKAPAGTTGWFLPSAQQWVKMMTGLGGMSVSDIKWLSWFDNNHTAADNWEDALKKAGEDNYDSMTDAYLWYWSSSEYSQRIAVHVGIDATHTGGDYGFLVDYDDKDRTSSLSRVRSVLAF